MHVHIRVGLAAGAVGFVLGYLAQLGAGLGALALLGLVAVVAGLGTAKWLPRDWYGHQLRAGAQAGVAAGGLTAIGILLSLGVSGKHDMHALAIQSHLLGLNLSGAIHALSPIGWLGAGLVLSLVGGAIGAGLAGVVALAAAWDKNRHAIEVVARAREAAQRGSRGIATGRPTRDLATPPVSGTRLGKSDAAAVSSPGSTPAMPRPHPPVRFPRVRPARPEPLASDPALPAAFAAWGEPQANQAPIPPSGYAPTAPAPSGPQPPPQPQRAPDPPPDGENWLC